MEQKYQFETPQKYATLIANHRAHINETFELEKLIQIESTLAFMIEAERGKYDSLLDKQRLTAREKAFVEYYNQLYEIWKKLYKYTSLYTIEE